MEELVYAVTAVGAHHAEVVGLSVTLDHGTDVAVLDAGANWKRGGRG